ncbi:MULTISPECIES: hypothetical protein [unclassified Vibrio]|uniref:hypothetical protein n=1 Tax=unclassified Vibrio TaxID=2614977 RepID=UPI000B8E9151|nr:MULTISPECIES: hypothetical protein [unclassified Vibrio]NAX44824.1 hypothetical protein [Vibrio sp. V25_P4S6T154]OXX40921.1 hypothetical protein B9J93_21060 [Vibrio sp. V17_P4S1T151]OXX59175.1 hypothetical protein B9J89_19520 [Vibrio sp. V15_P4S5T153]OXX65415.1 hypothetical protein B9J94_15410 [Vibrio sp. V20_P4S3T152]
MIIKTEKIEVTTLHEAMIFFRGNQSQAAIKLAVNRGTLRKYLSNGGKQLVRVHRDEFSEIASLELING